MVGLSDLEYSMKELHLYLLYAAAALGLVIYMLMIKEKKYWDTFEMLMSGLYVFLIPFAGYVLKASVTGDPDDLSIYLLRLGLLANVAVGLGVYLTQDAHDPTVQSSILISNILSRGISLMSSVYGCLFNEATSKEIMGFDLCFFGMLILGNFAHLRKVSRKDGSLNLHSPVSMCLEFDAISTFFLGAFVLGFPTMFIDVIAPGQTIVGAHILVATSLGGLFLGGSVLSFATLCYKNETDALAVLKSKLVIYLPALLMAIYNHYVGSFNNTGHSTVMIGVQAGLALNVLIASVIMLYAKSKED